MHCVLYFIVDRMYLVAQIYQLLVFQFYNLKTSIPAKKSFRISLENYSKETMVIKKSWKCSNVPSFLGCIYPVSKVELWHICYIWSGKFTWSQIPGKVFVYHLFVINYCYPASQMSYFPSSLLVSVVAKGAVQLLNIRKGITNYTKTIGKCFTRCILHILVYSSESIFSEKTSRAHKFS